MKLREAGEAAMKGLPIIYQGIEYSRITFVGYKYDENLKRSGSIQLLDKCGHSVTDADPELCTIKEAQP